MTPDVIAAAAIAALAAGIYLIAASLGAVQFAMDQLVVLAVVVFGAVLLFIRYTTGFVIGSGIVVISLFILGAAVATDKGTLPLFILGVVFVYISLVALAVIGRR
jgi:hypothetical protein